MKKDSSKFVEKIEALMKKKNSPLKPKTISKHLGIHKSIISKLLYSHPDKFRKCDPYEVGCWKDISNFSIWSLKA